MKKTKIIATIGPSSMDSEILRNMAKEGAEIVRINTKFGDEKQWLNILQALKKIKKCEILFDINSTQKINWIKKQKFDYIAVSYAKNAKHLKNIRKLFFPNQIKLIAKIETQRGVKNFDEILKESDGIMIGRGDLAKNISFERIPIEQKIIIKKCLKHKKFVVTATEMLLSLVSSKSPEKSEVSDIANAVIDGSCALMLSEETAVGKYPSLAVKTMKRIIDYTEKNIDRIK